MDLCRVAAYAPTSITDEDRDAAVLVPVLDRPDGEHLLFTKRADHLGEHPGQMSFPGGGREPRDVDRKATAIREAGEEIGIAPEEVTLVGRLDDIRTVSSYSVTPFVATVPNREYHPDEREVAEIAVLSVADLTDPANYEVERRVTPKYGDHLVHFFHVDGYTVWGATGRILVQLLELTTEWRRPKRVERVIDPDAEP